MLSHHNVETIIVVPSLNNDILSSSHYIPLEPQAPSVAFLIASTACTKPESLAGHSKGRKPATTSADGQKRRKWLGTGHLKLGWKHYQYLNVFVKNWFSLYIHIIKLTLYIYIYIRIIFHDMPLFAEAQDSKI